ncbi:MAG: asparaginase [Firmicutes bacterium]|nr:asparaginase [Bacillota bacterium]
MKITFIQVGGTIDKRYPVKAGQHGFEIGEPAYIGILENARVNFEWQSISAFKKDSLDLSEQDVQEIVRLCQKAKTECIIVTHGTDTLTRTARALSVIRDKTIILTGAVTPEACKNSDAAFNIGTAVGAAGALCNGVYIAMNGRVYPYDACEKDLKTCKFMENK